LAKRISAANFLTQH